jgi:hypothetical protein
MCDIIWSRRTPAGILPGAHMMPGVALEVVEKYKETLKKYPNPPAGNLTRF